jgi:hypothetical protein
MGHNQYQSKTDQQIFEARLTVDEYGCWVFTDKWAESKEGLGYGRFRYQGFGYIPARFAYELYKGESPTDQVGHQCTLFGAPKSNKRCCNPDHLINVTASQNAQDKIRDGSTKWSRNKFGLKGCRSHPFITDEQAMMIFIRAGAGEPILKLAEEFGVSWAAIKKIAGAEHGGINRYLQSKGLIK